MIRTASMGKGLIFFLVLACALSLTRVGLGQAAPAVPAGPSSPAAEATAAPTTEPAAEPTFESTALPQPTDTAGETTPAVTKQNGQPVVVVRPPADDLRDIMLGMLFIVIIGVVLFVLLRRLRT